MSNHKNNPTSFRLSEKAKQLLAELAAAMGLSQAAVLEHALRLLAKRELPAEKK